MFVEMHIFSLASIPTSKRTWAQNLFSCKLCQVSITSEIQITCAFCAVFLLLKNSSAGQLRFLSHPFFLLDCWYNLLDLQVAVRQQTSSCTRYYLGCHFSVHCFYRAKKTKEKCKLGQERIKPNSKFYKILVLNYLYRPSWQRLQEVSFIGIIHHSQVYPCFTQPIFQYSSILKSF